jgi:hypothetical protein
VRDAWGKIRWIHQRIGDVEGEEMAKRASDPVAHEAMRYVEETLDGELAGRATSAGE